MESQIDSEKGGESFTSRATSLPPLRLVGFDNAGEPFLSGGRVLRGIYRGHAATVRKVLRVCEENDLFRYGIVATREIETNPWPQLDYEMVLEHERIPFITYAHEWSGGMLKEAARFHIELFERLHEHGLTVKDWSPQNILFSATRPIFVDFTSIIPIEALPTQSHLSTGGNQGRIAALWDETSKALYEMYRLMFEPYFDFPLVMMHRGRHSEARRRIYETTLNASPSVITRKEAFEGAFADRLIYKVDERRLRMALVEKGPLKRKFFQLLERITASRNAAVSGSAYSTYYEDKNEDFPDTPTSAWTRKQEGVYETLRRFEPRSVLDLGSNTGWFSKLAARLGSSVVAVDLDEASIEKLFRDASRDNLDILPLVANLTQPRPPLYPRVYADEPSLSLLGDGRPLVMSPSERLQCEMVLALAIVHHLTLGQGLDFQAVAGILSGLSTRYLCVEFVDIDDAMITSDPDFFPARQAAPDAFGWYSLENFITALKSYYRQVEVQPSHPVTRSLLICSR